MLVTEVLRNNRSARHCTLAFIWRNKSEVLISASVSENLQGILPGLERRGTRGRSHGEQPLRGCGAGPARSSGKQLGRRDPSKFDDYDRRRGACGRAHGSNQRFRKLALFEWKVPCRTSA